MIGLAQPWIDEAEGEAVAAVLRSGWITEGARTREWEAAIAGLVGVRHAMAGPNGTLALYLGLTAMGIGPGDEVIVPDFTFIASSNAVAMTGGTPVFVDVCADTLNLDPELIEAAITPRTRAIMAVHIFGQPADMPRISAVAGRHRLPIIEDAAQALSVTFQGRPAGSYGLVSCFSFFADKVITTGGEGGMVLTSDDAIRDRVVSLKNQGRPARGYYIHPEVGYNFRSTEMQSAFGLAQLGKLPRAVARRREVEVLYRGELARTPGVEFPGVEQRAERVPFRANVLVDDPEGLMRYLDERGVTARRFFYPLHAQPCYAGIAPRGEYPVAQRAYDRGLSLPMGALLTDAEVREVCGHVRAFLGARA